MNGVAANGGKEVQKKVKLSNSEEHINENAEKSIAKAKLITSSSSLGNSKGPLCHVQVSSTENLKAVENDIAKNEFIKPDEAMAWLIKPIDTAKFFKYVYNIEDYFIQIQV